MGERIASSLRPRVVFLSPDSATAGGELRPLADAGIECVFRPTAYEAAAEILAGPAVALVIELRMIGLRGLRLLEIARERDVEVLGMGTLSSGLSAEDLRGVRLVGRRDLPDVLGRLAGPAASPEAGPPVPARPEPRRKSARTGKKKAKARKKARPVPSKRSLPEEARPEPAPRGGEPAAYLPGEQAAPGGRTTDVDQGAAGMEIPGGLLTPEELTALLGNKP